MYNIHTFSKPRDRRVQAENQACMNSEASEEGGGREAYIMCRCVHTWHEETKVYLELRSHMHKPQKERDTEERKE